MKLQIAYVHLGRATVSTDDALRLIARHPLQTYSARGQQDADTIAAALAGKSRLTAVEVAVTDLTDTGLRRLPLQCSSGRIPPGIPAWHWGAG